LTQCQVLLRKCELGETDFVSSFPVLDCLNQLFVGVHTSSLFSLGDFAALWARLPHALCCKGSLVLRFVLDHHVSEAEYGGWLFGVLLVDYSGLRQDVFERFSTWQLTTGHQLIYYRAESVDLSGKISQRDSQERAELSMISKVNQEINDSNENRASLPFDEQAICGL